MSEPGGRDRDSFLIGLTARLSRLRPARAIVPRQARVAAFVHTAFWRESTDEDGPEQESYIGPVLSALSERLGPNGLWYVGVGPRQNFRARRWWDPVTTIGSPRPLVTPIERLSRRVDLKDSLALWSQRQELAKAITAGNGVRAAGMFREIDLWPVLRRELEGVALLQWPWSARAMDEAASAIDALMPDAILTYAEAGGWGRALVLEARRRGVRSIGLQHGFIYRHWLNYRHEPDEMAPQGDDRGFPAPDKTLLFDGYAAQSLESAGHFPPASLVVTGNPGLDALTRRLAQLTDGDRPAIRGSLAVKDDQRVVVLAAKFSEARAHLRGARGRVAHAAPRAARREDAPGGDAGALRRAVRRPLQRHDHAGDRGPRARAGRRGRHRDRQLHGGARCAGPRDPVARDRAAEQPESVRVSRGDARRARRRRSRRASRRAPV